MEAGLTSLEFAEFMADYQLEPWGESRADLRSGIIASTLANCHRSEDRDPYRPGDFMPSFGPADEAAEEQPVAEMPVEVFLRLIGNGE